MAKPKDQSRRDFFKFAAGALVIGGGVFFAGTLGHTRTIKQIQKVAQKLPKVFKRLPPLPVDPAVKINGLSPLISPNKSFFQIDTGGGAPIIDPDTWTLKIDGMVKNPITVTYKDLLSRPLFELDNTLSCVSNPVGGLLVGNARWIGVRLDDLIREAMPTARADQVLASSDDGFGAGFPLSVLDGRDAMIAIGMNGEVLPGKHGYPARLIVPGLYGYVSATKWVTHIELTRFDIKQGYWISQGWSALAPIKMGSRIDVPQQGSQIAGGKTTIAGVAWAPDDGVSAVEVQVDNGEWVTASLGPELAATSWRQWWLETDFNSGNHGVTVRARNSRGEVQTQTPADVLPNGAQGWHSVNFSV